MYIFRLSSLIRNRGMIQKGYYYRTPWAEWVIRSVTQKGRAVVESYGQGRLQVVPRQKASMSRIFTSQMTCVENTRTGQKLQIFLRTVLDKI